MNQLYVDLLDNNKIVTRHYVADSRKEHALRNVSQIPSSMFDALGIAQLSINTGEGNPTYQAALGPDGYYHVHTPYTEEQRIGFKERTVQQHLDSKARELGYDDINSVAKYQGAPNPFQAEANALGAWAGECWATAFQMLQDYQNDIITEPTDTEVIAALPAYVPPA